MTGTTPQAGLAGILLPMVTRNAIGMILALLLLVSCSATQEPAVHTPSTIDEPDIRLTDAIYSLGRSGERPITIRAKTISVYLKTDRAIFEELSFEQADGAGQVDLEGVADRAEANTDNYDLDLIGNVLVKKRSEQFSVEAERLSWDDEEQLLQSEGPATVRFDGKNMLSGTGFSADVRRGVYEFASLEKGVLGQ